MFTRVMMVLDRSGSMGLVRQATIDGVNEYLEERRREAASGLEQRFSLLTFSNAADIEWLDRNMDVRLSKPLTEADYDPVGATALFDAIVTAVTALDEEDSLYGPAPALLVIVTDGGENASVTHTRFNGGGAYVRKLLEDRQREKGWTVYYLGANQDAFAVGTGLGVMGNNTLTYSATDQGMRSAFLAASVATNAYNSRGGTYSANDLAEAKESSWKNNSQTS